MRKACDKGEQFPHVCSFIIVLISGSVLSLTSYFCCFMVVLVHKSSNDFLGVKMIPKKDQKPDRQRRRQIDIALTEETKRGINHTWALYYFEGVLRRQVFENF